jgi:hypothetical protein
MALGRQGRWGAQEVARREVERLEEQDRQEGCHQGEGCWEVPEDCLPLGLEILGRRYWSVLDEGLEEEEAHLQGRLHLGGQSVVYWPFFPFRVVSI